MSVESVEADADRLEKANARRRAALEEAALLDAENAGDEGGAVSLPGAGKAQEIVNDLKGQGSFEVYKLDGGKQSKLATHDIDAWPEAMESLVKRVGPGDYLTIFRDGSGKQVGRITRTFDAVFCGTPAALPAPAAPDMTKFMELLLVMQEKAEARIEAMRAESSRQQQESLKMVIEMVKASQSSPLKTMQDLAAAKNLFKDNDDPIQKMLDMRDLLEEFKGSAEREDESPWLSVLNKFAQGFMSRQGPRRAHTPPAPAPAPSSAAPTSPALNNPTPSASGGSLGGPLSTEAKAQAPEKKIDLSEYVDSLALAIAAGADAEETADKVFSECESKPAEFEVLRVQALNGDWEALYKNPKLNSDWVFAFHRALLDLVSPKSPASV